MATIFHDKNSHKSRRFFDITRRGLATLTDRNPAASAFEIDRFRAAIANVYRALVSGYFYKAGMKMSKNQFIGFCA